MNFGLMIDSAVALSAYAPHLVASGIAPHEEALGRYWSLSRARQRHWQELLQPLNSTTEPRNLQLRDWKKVEGTLTDLFVDELSTRVVAAVFVASDAVRHVADAGPIARNIFLGHLEARQTALRLLVNGPLPEECVVHIDRLRRRVERWTDLLLGHLVVRYGCDEFAVDPQRARDFGEEQMEATGSAQQTLWDTYRQCLRTALLEFETGEPLAGKFRENLVRATLSWLPPTLTEECGALNSVWAANLLQPGRVPGLSGEDMAYWKSQARRC